MSLLDNELEEQLINAGNKLLDPPYDVDELLPLLDKAESYLSSVVQSPIETLQSALSPYLKALVTDKLLRHSDTDVKVAVAACISEITRITAPDAPFDDEHMKGAFQLIVSSFEHLDDNSSRSYVKRTTILETLAKVRSCVVLLDLECDALILEMFQHFLKGVRDHHSEHVFSLMETIMALVIEESEDISTELLSPILVCLKKDNEGVLPIAKRLAEKVLESSAPKLKPYLGQVLESLGTKADDYSKAVGLVFHDDSGEKKQNDLHEETGYEIDKVAAPVSVMSNGARPVEEGSTMDSDSLTKHDNAPRISRLKITGLSSINKRDKSRDAIESKKVVRSSQSGKKREKKHSTLASEPVDSARIDDPEKSVDNQRACSNVRPSSPHKDKSAIAELPAEGEMAEVDLSSPKETSNESVDVASPSKTGNADEVPGKKVRRLKKKQGLLKGSEGDSCLEAKANVRIGKKTGGGASNDDRTPLKAKLSKKGAHPIIDVDNKSSELSNKKIDKTPVVKDDTKVKSQKHSSKKIDASTAAIEAGSSLKSAKDKKGHTKGKRGPKKEMTESSQNDDDQKKSSSKTTRTPQTDVQHETPKTSSKRKRTPEKEGSDDKVYGEELVGKRIKVWWPQDRKFYEGTIYSFDSKKVKHAVKYDDGDEEILNLRKQRWEFVQGGCAPDEEKEVSLEDSDSDSIETKIPLNKFLKMKFGKSGKKMVKKSGNSSAKSKATSATPDPKLQDTNATDTNMEKDSSCKSKDQTPNIGSKIVGLALRMTKKAKGVKTKDEPETPEVTSTKPKKVRSKEGKATAVKKSNQTPKKVGKKVKQSNGSETVKPSESDSERTESVEGSEKVEIAPKKRKKFDSSSMESPGMGSKKGKKKR